MIEAAGALDADPGARTAGRRALIATLVFAGLRIGEATALTWADVDLTNGRISVRDTKTAAGERLVDILPALRDELASHRHQAGAEPDALVFPTSSGSRRDKDNARERVIQPVVAAAEELLAQRGQPPLPAGVTAHKLRHTFASILYVRGEDPPCVMGQLGHTDAGFTLRVYAPCDAPRRGRQAASDTLQSEVHQGRGNRRSPRTCGDFGGWARRLSNLRPLACEARSRGGRTTAGAGPIVPMCRRSLPGARGERELAPTSLFAGIRARSGTGAQTMRPCNGREVGLVETEE